MLVNCNSCQKKFTVPDSAILQTGRLLQCGYCGNKWTQYPIKGEDIKKEIRKKTALEIPPTKIKKSPKLKPLAKKKKREINLYSEEYLKKKHGLEISNSIDNKKIISNKKTTNSSFFFTYLIIVTIYIIAFFGILNISKDFIILNYPFTETYISSLYEALGILKAKIYNIIY